MSAKPLHQVSRLTAFLVVFKPNYRKDDIELDRFKTQIYEFNRLATVEIHEIHNNTTESVLITIPDSVLQSMFQFFKNGMDWETITTCDVFVVPQQTFKRE
jgi:hypothetical protein